MVQTKKFRHEPNYKQFLCLQLLYDFVTKYILFGGAAGGGKSWVGCEWLLAMCLNYPGVRYFMARDELKSLKDTTVKTFFKVAKHHGVSDTFRYYEHYSAIRFNNGSEIALLELKYIPSDPMFERLGSTEYTGGLIEEAGEVHFNAFDTIKSRIGRHLNEFYNIPKKILITCNPKKNWLYHTFYKPFIGGFLELGYAFIQSLAAENDKIDKGYIEGLDDIKDQTKKKRLKDGDWEYDNDPLSLVGYDKITDIFSNEYVPRGQWVITADIARFGQGKTGKTSVRVWCGLRVEKKVQKNGLSITDSAALIRQLANEYRISMSKVLVDEDGVGGGVVDILKCKGFIANSTPLHGANFDMLKSQCGYRLSELIEAGEIYENEPSPAERDRITEQLQQLKRKALDSDKKQAILSKEVIVKDLGYSPDDLDEYIMRAWFEVGPKKSNSFYKPSFHKV